MKTKRIKLISIILATMLALSCVALLIFYRPQNKVYAAEIVMGEWSQKDGALLGDTLVLPQDVKLKIDGEEVVPENGLIIYPDGNARTLGTKLLDSVGVYTLRYTATHSGKEYMGEQKFTVKDSNYFVSNSNFSSANYITADELKQTVIGERLGSKAADGIMVSMIEGNYFRYNQPININEVQTDDKGFVEVSVAYPVLDTSIYATEKTVDGKANNGDEPRYWGDRYCWYFTVKLIDAYDEGNFVEFYMLSFQDQPNGHSNLVVGAGGSEQELTNLGSAGADYDVTIDGSNWTVQRGSRYNNITYWASLISKDTRTFFERDKEGIVDSFKFNPETFEVRFENGDRVNRLVTDLDHSGIYPNNPFEGFTTGEVYVQYEFVKKEVNNSDPMELYIKSVLGISGEDLMKKAVDDTQTPDVNIDIEYTNKAEKSINVAYNQEYTLPTAEVFDVNGENEYKVAVYYDYYTDNPKSVLVTDGKFIPDKKGVTYTAVYMVKDTFGNVNVDGNGKCLDVINMKVVPDSPFEYDGTDKVSQLTTCSANEIPKLDVKSLNLDADVQVFVVAPNGDRVDITDTLNGDAYSYVPEYVGEYTVEYVFTDNVYTDTFSYKVNSVDEGDVLYKEKITLPSVFIKGATYDLEAFYAYSATANGLTKNEASLYVSVDGGAHEKINDRRNFTVEGSDYLTFYGEYAGVKSASQTCDITDVNFSCNPDVNNGYKIYENYFVGYDSYESDYTGVVYNFDGQNTVNVLQYATPLLFNAFSLEFEVPSESALNMSDYSILVKEISGNEGVGYLLTYKKLTTAGKVSITVSDLAGTVYLSKTVDGNFDGGHSAVISNNILTVPEIGVVALPGVTSRNVELSVIMNCLAQPVSMKIKNVCGNVFVSCEYMFEKTPQLIYTRLGGTLTINTEYTLPSFDVNSVFVPISLQKLTYSFTDIQGNSLLDTNGNKILNVTADKVVSFNSANVNNYFMTFNYEGMRVEDTSKYSISIVDTTPPVVVFTDGSNTQTVVEVKVGQVHSIKEFTVTDDTSTELNVKVVVMDAAGAVKGWDVDKTFVFKAEGKYRVIVFAQDENDNTSTNYYYRVNVTK